MVERSLSMRENKNQKAIRQLLHSLSDHRIAYNGKANLQNERRGVGANFLIEGVLALTVFRFKVPDIKLRAVTIDNYSNLSGTLTRFNLTLREEIALKNQNLGEFKYDKSEAILSYGGKTIGEEEITSGRIKLRYTKLVVVLIEAKFEGLGSNQNLGSGTNSGILTFNSYIKLSGKVNLMMISIKKRTSEMNCTLKISLVRTIGQVELSPTKPLVSWFSSAC
ncbi:hypothetical protein Patl1_00515 [Pistacia atlantica]|uniref:Uncharacterized protein n=1 Tax=Pistacia atlantica TaxID=434234 RepID=A0ACC1C7X0_9ROSI|nr:hypothetical protein Patl1_00515 [Pistacia atlantica]